MIQESGNTEVGKALSLTSKGTYLNRGRFIYVQISKVQISCEKCEQWNLRKEEKEDIVRESQQVSSGRWCKMTRAFRIIVTSKMRDWSNKNRSKVKNRQPLFSPKDAKDGGGKLRLNHGNVVDNRETDSRNILEIRARGCKEIPYLSQRIFFLNFSHFVHSSTTSTLP